jgi:ABC-2 type transport system ATP-binding protein
MVTSAIETIGLTRRFGKVTAVDNLDLMVRSGTIYGFLGPNGAGKTTTIRLLLGLIRPDAGAVRVFGMPLRTNRLAVLRKVGALVEAPALYPNLTGRENLRATQELVGLPRSRIDESLRLVGLTRDADRLVGGYSLGMRQRLGLALALLGEPELLVLDEPTNGLDPAGIQEMRELIRGLPGQHGITVFLSSHLLGEVEQIARDVGIIGSGKLLFQGTLPELLGQHGERFLLDVDRPLDAATRLVGAGWSATIDSPVATALSVVLPNRASAADVVALLVHAGIRVFQAHFEQRSLERLFLDLTAQHTLGVHAT